MKVLIDSRIYKFLNKLNQKDAAKALQYIELFEEYGFSLDERYLKKVNGPIWELRPTQIRLYIYIKAKEQIIIHAIIKKSQKIRQEDLKLILQRSTEYT